MQNSVIEEIQFIARSTGIPMSDVHHFIFGSGDTSVAGNTTPVSIAKCITDKDTALVVTRVDIDAATDTAGALNVASRSPNLYPKDAELFWLQGSLAVSQKQRLGVNTPGAYHLLANSSCFFVFRSESIIDLQVAFFAAAPIWFNARVNAYLVPVLALNKISNLSSTLLISPL
jgi:hypothetical protein